MFLYTNILTCCRFYTLLYTSYMLSMYVVYTPCYDGDHSDTINIIKLWENLSHHKTLHGSLLKFLLLYYECLCVYICTYYIHIITLYHLSCSWS